MPTRYNPTDTVSIVLQVNVSHCLPLFKTLCMIIRTTLSQMTPHWSLCCMYNRFRWVDVKRNCSILTSIRDMTDRMSKQTKVCSLLSWIKKKQTEYKIQDLEHRIHTLRADFLVRLTPTRSCYTRADQCTTPRRQIKIMMNVHHTVNIVQLHLGLQGASQNAAPHAHGSSTVAPSNSNTNV